LDIPISDHVPYVIQITTKIPKANVLRFENYWVNHSDFLDTVKLHWEPTPFYGCAAKTINAKFKQTRRGLKPWSKSFSNLNRAIHNSGWVLALLDGLEDAMPLSRLDKNSRKLVKSHLAKLLESKRTY
jgi:hypothetical protein